MGDEASDLSAVLHWLAARGFPDAQVEALTGDLSPRRYWRLRHSRGTAVVVAHAAAAGNACARFLATTALLADAGVRVPAIVAADCAHGFMVVEDLGLHTLYEIEPSWSTLAPFFERAIEILPRVRSLPVATVAALNPPLDATLLDRELRQTWDCFLIPHGLAGDSSERAALEHALATLCAKLGAAAPVPCHRDFMVRNLVPLANGEVGVLDHQDLRLGPRHYDFASLLNDSRFPPPELEEALLRRAFGSEPAGEERLAYHRAAAQRTLKAVGTYAVFAQRGADRHLPLIPSTLRRAVTHLRQIPEAAALASTLERRWASSMD